MYYQTQNTLLCSVNISEGLLCMCDALDSTLNAMKLEKRQTSKQYINHTLKVFYIWGGEITQWLRIFAPFAEDPDLVSTTHVDRSQLPVMPAPTVSTPSSGLQGDLHPYATHTEEWVQAETNRLIHIYTMTMVLNIK